MTRPAALPPPERYPHGARARYVTGCRCELCRGANATYARERTRERQERAAEAKPSGPPGSRILVRGGREHHVTTCPGANGAACIRTPATWLRGGPVCRHCVARVTGNGLVAGDAVRKHLRTLSRRSVGRKAVRDATDVSGRTLDRLARGGKVRASTAARILAVDAGARADHSLVPAGPTRRLLQRLTAAGYTEERLAEELGRRRVKIGERVHAVTAQRVERLYRRLM